jgi:hypothetical protein
MDQARYEWDGTNMRRRIHRFEVGDIVIAERPAGLEFSRIVKLIPPIEGVAGTERAEVKLFDGGAIRRRMLIELELNPS